MSSFLGLILERIEYDTFERLIEEGRDPIELLSYKYSNVPSEIIHKVVSIDPTKKKSYSQWLLSHWDDESDTIVNNLKNGRIEKLFQHYKEHQDIQIKDCPSVEEGLMKFVPEVDTVLTKSSNPTTTLMNNGWTKEVPSELANDFDIVFDEDDWVIAVPHTYEADCKLGENMNWCTAGGRSDFNGGRSYYNNYLSRGDDKYYVNFDMTKGESRLGKDYPFTRYQFHFGSHQFMDKDDEPVTLSEIDMPQSAIDFYGSEGYDTSDFKDYETRWERYDQQRSECSYGLNDDLYLEIEFDDNFQFEEPDENTDFYIFDINHDERDPIIWEAIPNPHVNEDVVIVNREDRYVLLKGQRYDEEEREAILAINEVRHNIWSDNYRWGGYKVKQWIELPDEMGIFGIDENYGHQKEFTVYTVEGASHYDKLKGDYCEKIFINEACIKADSGKWDRIFIETINAGYHTLFTVDGDGNLDCIVKRDDPKNGEYYVIEENGVVEGLYGRYRAYDDGTDDGQEYTKYHLVRELGDGYYIVGQDATVSDGYDSKYVELKNILRQGDKEPLLDVWVDDFIDEKCGLLVAEKGNKYAYFNLVGQQIGKWYVTYGFIDEKQGIAVGQYKESSIKTDIISARENKVIFECINLSSQRAFNNKIMVIVDRKDMPGVPQVKCYDYVEKKFCFNEFENIRRISSYSYENYYCKLVNSEENVIFNFEEQQIKVRGLKNLTQFDRYTEILREEKLNGKFNVYQTEASREVLPTDVDEITYADTLSRIIIYVLNGRYFIYDFRKNGLLYNENGFDVPVKLNDYNWDLYFTENGYSVIFRKSDFNFKGWTDLNNDRHGYTLDERAPQEVIDIYNRVTGQQQQPQQQNVPQEDPSYAVAEQFKRFVNRINKAEKLRYNDIID